MIEAFDTALRLITTGSSLLLLILLISGDMRRIFKVSLAGLLVGAVAYLINSSSVFRQFVPYLQWFDLASLFTPFWLWLFARHLFERPAPAWLTMATAATMTLSWAASNFAEWTRPVGFYVIHFIGLALVADLVRVALADRTDDLIEKRRLIRLWFPILVAAQSGGILSVEIAMGDAIRSPELQAVNAVLILALNLFAGLVLLRTDPELLVETEGVSVRSDRSNALSPTERVLKEQLEGAMASHYYRTPGLTIAGLAQHLETPEHRLRALINRGLGHRNFSAFLNSHRIAEARAILADKSKVDLPVLTIAMDLGYNSLATFNRAFRAETGTTPSDYRRAAIDGATGQN